MARWEPDSRGRLEQAALELYGERGFESTTVAEIAARAGRDRADVLPLLHRQARGPVRGRGRAAGAAGRPPSPTRPRPRRRSTRSPRRSKRPARCSRSAASTPGSARPSSPPTPSCSERELIKLASLAAALADALRRRGVADPAATLTAEAGIAVFKVAFERWVDPAAGANPAAAHPRVVRRAEGGRRRLIARGCGAGAARPSRSASACACSSCARCRARS